MAKGNSRIYPCFLSRDAALSAASSSRCSISLRPLVASAGAKRPVSRVMPSGIGNWSRLLGLASTGVESLAVLLSTRALSRSAESVESPSVWPSSACPREPPRPGTPSTEATARHAPQSARSSGSGIIREGLRRTSARRSLPPTASLWRSTKASYNSRVVYAPSAVAQKGLLATASCSGCRSTMTTRPALCGEFSAIPATVRSASSERTSQSSKRPSPTCCGIKKSSSDNGEGCCPSPTHRGGQ